MKTISRITIFSTLLAGTLTAGAHPPSGQQFRGDQQGRRAQPPQIQDGRRGPSRQLQQGRQRQMQPRRQQGRRVQNRSQDGARRQYAQQGQPQRNQFQQSRQGGDRYAHAQPRRQGRQVQNGRQGGVPPRIAQSRKPQMNAQQNPRVRRGAAQQQLRAQNEAGSRNPERAGSRKRQAMLKRFDTDQDGRLSAKERQAIQERMRSEPGTAPRRPESPPVNN